MSEIFPSSSEKSFELPADLVGSFRQNELYQLSFLFERSNIKPEDFFELARVAARNSEELFETYHNLFSLQQHRSKKCIESLMENWQAHLEDPKTEAWEQRRWQTKLDIGRAYIGFMEKYDESWETAHMASRTLEETLK